MAFLGFGKDNKKEEKPEVVQKTEVKKAPKTESKVEKLAVVKSRPTSQKTSVTDYTGVLITPRITEKASIIAEEGNVYTFNVHPDATKKEIAKAIENNYKVKPIKVNIAKIKRKKILSRGKIGMKAGGKKAMVYLKKEDKIEFV